MKQRQVTFWVGQQMYCLPLLMVGEFCPGYEAAPVAGVDERIRGVAHLRGASTVVLDMQRVLQVRDAHRPGNLESILIVPQDRLCDEANQQGLRTYVEPLILEVDELADIVLFDEAERHETPAHLDEPFYQGVHETAERNVIEINFAKLIQFLTHDFQEAY